MTDEEAKNQPSKSEPELFLQAVEEHYSMYELTMVDAWEDGITSYRIEGLTIPMEDYDIAQEIENIANEEIQSMAIDIGIHSLDVHCKEDLRRRIDGTVRRSLIVIIDFDMFDPEYDHG